ncbi:MAG: tRNA adenosine(34) deaminase TadA [Pseudomonadales bacterium]|nr:tRNA adenosine(34) deaminase TadA [Pseudomonadales bacterium]
MLLKDDEHWMGIALSLAASARDMDEVPVGAVVVRDNEIIGEGFNQTLNLNDPSAHAEIMALRDAARKVENYRLVDACLYVTIEPCTMCAGALIHARIRRLVYGAKEPRAGAIESSIQVLDNPSLNHKLEVTSGVCEDAASEIMSTFFRSKRKKT